MIENLIVISLLAIILGFSAVYIIKAKKNGKKCIGCPAESGCQNKAGCSGCSSCHK